MDTAEHFITVKLFLAVFAVLEDGSLVDSIEALFTAEESDRLACMVLRLIYRQKWETTNVLQIASSLSTGIITAIKGLKSAQSPVYSETSLDSLDSIQLVLVENKARELSIKEREGEIHSVNNLGEVAEVLDLDSLILTMQVITLFTREILGETGGIEATQTGFQIQEKVDLAANTDSRLDDEINKFMKQLQE